MINDEESDAGLKDVDDVLEPTSQTARSQQHSTISNFYPANNQTSTIMINGGTLPQQHIKPVTMTTTTLTSSDAEKPAQPQRIQKPKIEAPEEKKVTEMRAPVKEVSEPILSEPGAHCRLIKSLLIRTPVFSVGKGPKTYATLVKSGSQVPTSFANIMSAAAQVLPVVDASTYPPIQSKAAAQQQQQQPLAAKNLPPKSAPNAVGPKPKPRLEERKEWKEPAGNCTCFSQMDKLCILFLR